MKVRARARAGVRAVWLPLLCAAGLAAVPVGAVQAAIEHDRDLDQFANPAGRIEVEATVGPGEDRFVLLVVTTSGSDATVSAATLGSTSFSSLGVVSSPTLACRVHWFGLVAPAVGAQLLRVELNAPAQTFNANLISYRGVDQAQPTGRLVAVWGPTGPTTVRVPSDPRDLVLDGVCGWSPDGRVMTAGPNQTARWHWSIASLSAAGSQKPGLDPDTTLTWTASGNGAMEWAGGGLALKPTGWNRPLDLSVGTLGCQLAGSRAGTKGGLGAGWPLAAALLFGWAGRRAVRRKVRRQRAAGELSHASGVEPAG